MNQVCPTCKQKNFTHSPNISLQQFLYGFTVYCSNRDEGCDWQGELGQLDQHLNLNPDKDKQEIGCAYTRVKCLHCSELYQRRSIKYHQTSECLSRPFTCEVCKEFESTFYDVTWNHAHSCKCKPVECPNRCGYALKYRDLEEHLSSVCPLSFIKCEFSHAGCSVTVKRKDLPSHLSESMVTHMSLLARENQRQESELQKQISLLTKENKKLKSELQLTKSFISSVPPIEYVFERWELSSRFFYSHIGGYRLQLSVDLLFSQALTFTVVDSEFQKTRPFSISVSATVIDQTDNKDHITYEIKLTHPSRKSEPRTLVDVEKYLKNDCLKIRIDSIKID